METGTTMRSQPRADPRSSIIGAGTAACRLYGPSKTNVVDIARLLGRSPASVYKIFPSKAAILDAIATNFFETDLHLPMHCNDKLNAADRLKEHALRQHRSMLEIRQGDRHMFDLVILAAEGSWASFGRHLKRLQAEVWELVRTGIEAEEFAPGNVDVAASCFCTSVISLWDPRIVDAFPSSYWGISAQELVSFAVGGLRQVHTG
ncbi:TetR/AcrR family transcriptional regulator [Rhizobium laguerreae]|uniref:TetR family transcriptional regulator n=1 Tax=Rhizobium laguerreae TaxID=1076926 RepID=UPI001C90555F|nr:TetR family transcriptional regulator [Rhizobium laguerreae]MBY3233416.1 TetR/AcrR family transcriptional regulator [Rhizobium laguerreae]